MTIVHLVRHGRPSIHADRPPSSWQLSPAARPEITRLLDGGVLPKDAVWVSSSEPKALESARALTSSQVLETDALREMRRPAGLLGDADFRAAVRTSLLRSDRPARPGWETGTATCQRVRTALETYRAMAGDRDLVLVGHGTAWTLLVAALTDSQPDVAAWARLRMPDHCAISGNPVNSASSASHTDNSPGLIVRPWGSWLL